MNVVGGGGSKIRMMKWLRSLLLIHLILGTSSKDVGLVCTGLVKVKSDTLYLSQPNQV